jgi:hypothetical protein
MNISFVKPRPELRRHIESLWVLQSASGFPVNDFSIISRGARGVPRRSSSRDARRAPLRRSSTA